jgi:hypothetical protein
MKISVNDGEKWVDISGDTKDFELSRSMIDITEPGDQFRRYLPEVGLTISADFSQSVSFPLDSGTVQIEYGSKRWFMPRYRIEGQIDPAHPPTWKNNPQTGITQLDVKLLAWDTTKIECPLWYGRFLAWLYGRWLSFHYYAKR